MDYKYVEGLLQEMGISKRELARRIGVPASTITACFRRKSKNIPFETILKIADVLGVAFSTILDGRRAFMQKEELDSAIDNHVFPSTDELDKTLWTNIANGLRKNGHTEFSDYMEESRINRDKLVSTYDNLNPDGQTEALKLVQILSEVPRYQLNIEQLQQEIEKIDKGDS